MAASWAEKPSCHRYRYLFAYDFKILNALGRLQVLFEKTMTEDSSLGLLSLILSQNLGLDCTRVKIPEYTDGYLLGDHKVIK